MKVDLRGLARNIKAAMGSRDTHGWGYTLDELVDQHQRLQQFVSRVRARRIRTSQNLIDASERLRSAIAFLGDGNEAEGLERLERVVDTLQQEANAIRDEIETQDRDCGADHDPV